MIPHAHMTDKSPHELIQYHAYRTPDKLALLNVDGPYRASYAELMERIKRLASGLRQYGVQPGDRVAVLAQNDARVFEVLYACAYVGAIMVPVNFRLKANELSALFEDCTPSLLLCDDHTDELAQQALEEPSSVKTLKWSEAESCGYEELIASSSVKEEADEVPSEAPWVIIYTSGTTGRPKGVVHSRRSFMANVENSLFAGGISSSSVQLTILPTFHVAGLNLYANPVLCSGGTSMIMRSFDPARTLELFQDIEVGLTHCCGVPTNFQFISELPDFADAALLPFNATVGGSPVPSSVVVQWRARGVDVMPIYGVSEGGSSVLAMPPRGSTTKTAVGIPVVNAKASIRGEAGEIKEPCEVGELWIRGSMLMSEYWGQPEQTRAVLDEDGWFRTGDAAFVDTDGIVHIVDRWKDMYISGGENVYPAEVENVLYQHPDVLLASVVGAAHPKWGEIGKAFIVSRGSSTAEGELRAWCGEHLAKFKVPVEFIFVESLPQNATGKILKGKLRELA